MLHTKYQDSWPCCFRQKAFSCFPYISYVKHVTPGAGPFWHYLNKLDRGPLDGATYQIPQL